MPERYSTRAAYKSYTKDHIRPRWEDTTMSAVRPMAVEDWLKGLDLAPKTKSHVRSLKHTIFQCGERWELTAKKPIKLIRVKGGMKRLKTPGVLTPEEFELLLPLIWEPLRTMVLVAGCLGLCVSEIVTLQWVLIRCPGARQKAGGYRIKTRPPGSSNGSRKILISFGRGGAI
jgi:integrase